MSGGLTARARRWTLARRLSILYVGLLALVVFSFGAFAYRGVRDAAVQRASERLASIAQELSAGSARSSASRAAALAVIARDSTIVGVLDGGPAPVDAPRSVGIAARRRDADAADGGRVARALASHRVAADSTWMGMEVWDVAGTRRSPARAHGRDSVLMTQTIAAALQTGSVARSPAYAQNDRMYLWTAVPIRRGERVVGALAEQRRMGSNSAVEGLLARLTGLDVRVYITTRNFPDWASLLGKPIASPLGDSSLDAVPDSSTERIGDAPGAPVMVAASSVVGTPWRVVVMQNEASILARPKQMLVQLLLVGLLCLAVGTIGSLWLSQVESRPIVRLRQASAAMAAGDYTQTVLPSGAEETAALADAFNGMARQISTVHETLARRNAELVEANEAKARFLAVMSHELRTPLNAIGGHAELLTLGVYGTVSDGQREALERIGRNKDQLVALVTDILHYARQEANPLPVQSEPVSLARQFAAVRETVTDQFERKSVTLRIVDTTAWVCADPIRVQQVLINLVTNALQFTPADGTVTISATPHDDHTVVRVRDTGVGIPHDQHAAIFEPFVQVDNSLTRRSGGAGLGLAIVRQLVEAMGGQVSVDSTAGDGASFDVTLPGCDPLPEPTALAMAELAAGD